MDHNVYLYLIIIIFLDMFCIQWLGNLFGFIKCKIKYNRIQS